MNARSSSRWRWPPGPLFSRSDGDLIRDEEPLRVMIPHLMWGRNASVVYHESTVVLSSTRGWLRRFNQQTSLRASRFHLFLAACARTLHERPKLNRFVSGGRLYQRRKVVLAFVAKTAPRVDAPLVTVKLDFVDPAESFASIVERAEHAIATARTGERPVDRELALGARLPHALLRTAMSGYRVLDRFNLLPAPLIESDPSFSSLFVTNLGSLGLDRTYHHLYDLGTCSLMASLGRARSRRVTGARRVETLEVRWSFDERIADGSYCASALRLVRKFIEHPARLFGDTGTAGICRCPSAEI
jgi:hypothetical protein